MPPRATNYGYSRRYYYVIWLWLMQSALHDHIPLILLLNALSPTPYSRIVDILHLCDLYESKSSHVVIQRLSLGDGKAHLTNNCIDLGVRFPIRMFSFILIESRYGSCSVYADLMLKRNSEINLKAMSGIF